MAALAEYAAFLREFRDSYHHTGAMLPSSRYLAGRICRRLVDLPPKARILEVGPGTGAFTNSLLRRLRPDDELTLVELNGRFVDALRRRFETNAEWRGKRRQVDLVHGPVESLPAPERFHAIVCGLPFNNFDPQMVDGLLRKLIGHLSPGGALSFFEYLAIRRLKAPFVGAGERKRLRAVAAVLDDYTHRHQVACDRILLNFPPAIVHHLRAPAQ